MSVQVKGIAQSLVQMPKPKLYLIRKSEKILVAFRTRSKIILFWEKEENMSKFEIN